MRKMIFKNMKYVGMNLPTDLVKKASDKSKTKGFTSFQSFVKELLQHYLEEENA